MRGAISFRRRVKRAIDVTVAGAGILTLAPLMGLAAGAIRVTMGSPVLFRQQRPGLNGRLFELKKFRTMAIARADQGVESDSLRLTRLGQVLRKTSIDELPTLLNVLAGDMSLVGPRPLLVQYMERYDPQQARRHEVTPGITGWAQVHGRNTVDWNRRFELDVWYVDHWSLLLDLKILLKTIVTVLNRGGIHAEGHVTMPEFQGAGNTSHMTQSGFREPTDPGDHRDE